MASHETATDNTDYHCPSSRSNTLTLTHIHTRSEGGRERGKEREGGREIHTDQLVWRRSSLDTRSITAELKKQKHQQAPLHSLCQLSPARFVSAAVVPASC